MRLTDCISKMVHTSKEIPKRSFELRKLPDTTPHRCLGAETHILHSEKDTKPLREEYKDDAHAASSSSAQQNTSTSCTSYDWMGYPTPKRVIVREKPDHLKAVAREEPTEHEKSAEGSRDDGDGKGGADASGLRRADSEETLVNSKKDAVSVENSN